MVQQVVGVAVAVSADDHQGNEGGQEDSRQHPNSHDHHRLHGEFSRGQVIVRAQVKDGRSSVEERSVEDISSGSIFFFSK